MKIYFIRHAVTAANLAGAMVKNYDDADIIISEDLNDWYTKVGQYIPSYARTYIISSPAKRCLQTSQLLFNINPRLITDDLAEFDCKALNDKKFWEISKNEFDSIVKLDPSTMMFKANKIFEACKNFAEYHNIDNVICISHGMLIRYLYHYFIGNKSISAYDVINSNGYKFSNLDMLVIDTVLNNTKTYHYKSEINHNIIK